MTMYESPSSYKELMECTEIPSLNGSSEVPDGIITKNIDQNSPVRYFKQRVLINFPKQLINDQLSITR